MSTIEDKILDGPQVHYCEADNDDIRIGEDADEDKSHETNQSSLFIRPDEETERLESISRARIPGCSVNTGPKGVIEDHRKEIVGRNIKQSKIDNFDDLEAEFEDLLNDDSVLKEYAFKRIEQIRNLNTPNFGRVFRLGTGAELLDAIDRENSNVLVVVHIYMKYSRSCMKVDQCLDELANDMKHVKFVTLDASATGLSSNFKENGVPAILAYKGGNLIKSIIQLEELLDRDFDTKQIRELMTENGLTDFNINMS